MLDSPAMRRSTVGLLLIVTTMVAALAVLATMQYRWLGELSEAEQQRMRAALSSGTHEVAQEVDRDVNRISTNFQSAVADPDELARRAREWRSNARDARLVRTFYLAQPDDPIGGSVSLSRLDIDGGKLVPIPWPGELVPVETLVSTPESQQQRRPPVITSIPALVIPVRPLGPPDPGPPPRPAEWPLPDRRWPPKRRGPPDGRPPPPIAGAGAPPGAPPLRDEMPVQVTSLHRPLPPGEGRGEGPAKSDKDLLFRRDGAATEQPRPRQRRPPRPAILVAELDRAYIVDILVPDIARRFLGHDYDFAVISGRDVLSRSNQGWPRDSSDHGEADAPFPALRARVESGDPPWRLVVRQHGSAGDDLVERTRRRNLAIVAAVRLLLVASILLLVVLTRRAERLRLQQMEFVAGITHELNTPIAAVSSAGQNPPASIVREELHVTPHGA